MPLSPSLEVTRYSSLLFLQITIFSIFKITQNLPEFGVPHILSTISSLVWPMETFSWQELFAEVFSES